MRNAQTDDSCREVQSTRNCDEGSIECRARIAGTAARWLGRRWRIGVYLVAVIGVAAAAFAGFDVWNHTVFDPGFGLPSGVDGGYIPRTVVPFSRLLATLLPAAIILSAVVARILPISREARRQYAETDEMLRALDDVRVLPQLVWWLDYADRTLRERAEGHLARLLRCVRASDADCLPAAERGRLQRAFKGRNADLILAILAAFEQVGGPEELLPVQYLAEGLDAGRLFPEVRHAASACLPYLQVRADHHRASARLLRPSQAAEGSRVLLRPASGSDSTTERLLRPK